MPRYRVTIDSAQFEITADNEDFAREDALDMVQIEVEHIEDEDEEEDEEV